ncbi:MAG: cytochrome c [Nitrospirota bacterium]
MKSESQKAILFITAGIMGLFLIPSLFGINTGFNMMGQMGMMSRMGSGMMGGGMMQGQEKNDFSSNGEKIFFRGINSKGEVIKNTHGMEGVGCAMCHGADAKGTKMMMMDVPDISWNNLTDPRGHIHKDGRKHPPYTNESFKTCVLAGIDPAGNQLSAMMPRWEMSKEDIDDLVGYLKTK